MYRDVQYSKLIVVNFVFKFVDAIKGGGGDFLGRSILSIGHNRGLVKGELLRRFGTSALNRLRATPCPTIAPKIGMSPS